MSTESATESYAPAFRTVVAWLAVMRLLDLVAIGAGGASLSGRSCPLDCLQEGISTWDAHWYSSIAAFGYSYIPGTDSNVAFFPLFPLLMRALSPLTGGSYLWAGLLVSLVVSAGAVVVTWALIRSDLGAAPAGRAALLLVAAPAGFFFALPYADGLLLLAVASSIFCARRERWFWAGVLAAIAGTVRITGALVVIPIAWEWLDQNGWNLRAALGVRARRGLAALVVAPIGVAAYMGWLYMQFGHPLAFASAQIDGWPPRLTWFGEPIRYTVVQLMQPGGYLSGTRPDLYWAYLLDFTVIAITVALALITRKKSMPGSYRIWWGVAFLFPIMAGTTNSTARYALAAFPLFVAAALVFRKRQMLWFVAMASGTLQIAFARAHGMGSWVG